jgi:hypothetical protein
MIGDDHLRALGKIAAAYGTLEWLLENVFTAVVHPRDADVGEIILKKIGSVEGMMHLITELLQHHHRREQPLQNDWWELTIRISNAQQERNRLLHGGWLIEDDDRPEILTKLLKKNSGSKQYIVNMMEKIANDILAVNNKMGAFLAKLVTVDL